LRATVSDGFVADLKKVRNALSHKIPGGRLEDVLHECIRVTLAKIEKRRRGGGTKGAPAKTPLPGDPYIAAAVVGEVWGRDDGQCAFVGSTGGRCSSPYQVENHHRNLPPRAGCPRQPTSLCSAGFTMPSPPNRTSARRTWPARSRRHAPAASG
jgi:hypothetical protein